MDTRPSLGPGLEILLAREGGALGELPRAGRVLGRRAGGGVATLLPSLLGAQPTLSFCSCLWLFLHCPPRPPPPPRGLGTTDQGAGGGLAHLGQDAGFSTGGCQDPEDREEQGEDGQDAIHLEKSEPR